jgi:hypothetical protein
LRKGRAAGSVRRRNDVRPILEGLESRVVLYSASGNAWPNPQLVTISFMPDGTSLGGGATSNLFATFNSNPNLAGKWQNTILQAAQVWAQQTNINFELVADDGAAQGSGSDEQGDPGFGDIRIGGTNFGSSTLALTYQPPPANNFSLAGDVTFNTGQGFRVNTTYDLFTVAMHEIGHALGLNESGTPGSVEYGTYNGVMKGLASDDIAGIRSIYSGGAARSQDANSGTNGSLGKAASISSLINGSTLTALVPNLDVTTAGQQDWFSFTVPAGAASTLKLDVQSGGLSLLAPKLTVYASDGKTVVASASGSGQYGATLTASVSGVAAGQTYYVLVQGADSTQMGTGRYALGLNFAGGAPPTEVSPTQSVANGGVLHSGGGQADNTWEDSYSSANPAIVGISPDNGVSSQDGITNNPRISINGTAPGGDTVTVYCNGQAVGQMVAGADNTWTFNDSANPLSDGQYFFTAVATDSSGYNTAASAAYEVNIDTHVPQSPVLNDISPDTGLSLTDGITNVNRPTFSGTTEPFAVVNLYANGSSQPFGTTEADINGFWSYTVGQSGKGTNSGGVVGGLLSAVGSLLGGLLGGGQTGGSGQSLPDGTYQITATAMDVAGTVSAASPPMTIVIDTQKPSPPQITGISPDTGSGNDHITTAHNLVISGNIPLDGHGNGDTENLIVVLINGVPVGSTMADKHGDWSLDNTAMTLPDGTYAITAVNVDVAGNMSPSSGEFKLTIETIAPPAIAGVSLITGTQGLAKNQQGLSVIGTAPSNDQVQVYLGGSLLGTVNADGQGNWSYVYAPTRTKVPAGAYDFSAVAMDHSGSASPASPTLALQLGGGLTAGTPQYASGALSGWATPGSLVSIVDGDTVIGTATADASGNWQFTPALAKGHHTIMVDAADGSGDTSLLSGAITVKI